ncbi:MAG: DNA-3-methyladenine glycosylase [Geminicoccales bacterium]
MAPPVDVVGPEFFDRSVDLVAVDLIGRELRVVDAAGKIQDALIVETEGYGNALDPASHAAFRPGGRAAIMFGPPGSIYVYAAYGMYPCFNIVTGPVGKASAVLLRGVWRRGDEGPTLGPGRTTRTLAITLADHGDAIPGARFGVSTVREDLDIERSRRVGITRGTDTEWRFLACSVK